MKKKVLLAGLVLVLALSSLMMACAEPAPAPPPTPAQPILLRMVTDWEAGDARVDFIQTFFADEVAARTDGKVKIEIYPGSQLVTADKHVDAISSGLVDMGVSQLSEGWPTIVPELTILGISLFDNSAHAFRALDGPLGEMLAEALEEKANTKVLTFTTAGDVDAMGSTIKQIKTPDDLRGLTLRVSSAADAASCEALGAAGEIIAGPEMYMALQRGTVDGVFITSTRGVGASKAYEVCKYWTRIPIIVGAQFGFVINLDAWEALPKDIQKTLTEVATEAREAMLAELEAGGDKAWAEEMTAYPGVQVYTVPVGEISQWKDKMLPARLALLEKAVSADVAQQMLDWLAEAR